MSEDAKDVAVEPVVAKAMPGEEKAEEKKLEETKWARINIEGSKKKFAFLMEEGSGFGEAYDAVYSVLTHLLNAIKESAEKIKPKKPEENLSAEKKEEINQKKQ